MLRVILVTKKKKNIISIKIFIKSNEFDPGKKIVLWLESIYGEKRME